MIGSFGAVASTMSRQQNFETNESIMITPSVQYTDQSLVSVELSDEQGFMLQPGEPMLPFMTRVYQFPVGTKINDVHVEFSGVSEQTVTELVKPAPEPIIDAAYAVPSGSTQVLFDEGIYSSDSFYPGVDFSYNVAVGISDEEHVIFVVVKCFPVQYNPVKNLLSYATHADITIRYTPAEQVVSLNDVYDLVIIAPGKFSSALAPLVTHKNDMGLNTTIVTLEEIYTDVHFTVDGRDEAEQIKYFMMHAFEEWGAIYYMFVGGRTGGFKEEKWLMPVRYTHLEDNSDENRFLTDLYFADLYKWDNDSQELVFDDWDSNGNGVFGEWPNFGSMDEDIDMYPDVYVGRLACIHSLDVRLLVNQIIKYETAGHGTDWINQYVGVAGDTYPDHGDPYYEGELANNASFNLIEDMGYTADYLWTSTGAFKGKEDVLARISEGCGILHFSGHGSHWSWATHPPQLESNWTSGPNAFDMRDLRNKEKQPVVLVGGCHNAQFNTSITNMILGFLQDGFAYFGTNPAGRFWYREWIPKCWSWSMASRLLGGCIAIMANSGYGYGIPGEDCLTGRGRFMEIMFFQSYKDGFTTLGKTHATSLEYYMDVYEPFTDRIDTKIVQQWVLLGDPSLKIGGYPS